jgi:hypothetical protein
MRKKTVALAVAKGTKVAKKTVGAIKRQAAYRVAHFGLRARANDATSTENAPMPACVAEDVRRRFPDGVFRTVVLCYPV